MLVCPLGPIANWEVKLENGWHLRHNLSMEVMHVVRWYAVRRYVMIPCTVQETCGAWLITFPDGRTLLLTMDYDRAGFAVHCGAIHASVDWDGRPELLA